MWNPLTCVFLGLMMVVTPQPGSDAAAQSTGSEAVSAISGSGGPLAQYYSISPDLRKCAAPLCGGYWISAVNQTLTRCADGSRKEGCYVAEIEWDALDLNGSEGASLVLGKQRQKDFPSFGSFGVLIPQNAWRPATGQPAEGTWFLVRDSGVRCITYPCYSISESTLNGDKTQLISGLDLNKANAGPNEQSALADLFGGGLIAVGSNAVVPNEGPAGDGITLVASQFFLQVPMKQGSAAIAPNRFCEKNADCTTSIYQNAVHSREDCYCPLCPEPLNAKSARQNQISWERYCRNFGYFADPESAGPLVCPQVKCIAPAPLACLDRRCVYVEQNP